MVTVADVERSQLRCFFREPNRVGLVAKEVTATFL